MLVKTFNLLKFRTQSVQLLREIATDAANGTISVGTIPPKPGSSKIDILKGFTAVVSGILIGAQMAKGGANFLEENNLFSPADEDDDDD